MAICILLVCFVVIFLNLNVLCGDKVSNRQVLIYTVLTFSILLVFITELLGAFKAISYNFVLLSWSIVLLLNIVFIYIRYSDIIISVTSLKQRIISLCRSLSRPEKLWLLATAIILFLVFAQGIIYPPNNWDSMTYHLGRITSWISHGSIAYFPTAITPQLFQPPFAEFAIMHVNLLAGNDYFSAAVQFSFFFIYAGDINLYHKRPGPFAAVPGFGNCF